MIAPDADEFPRFLYKGEAINPEDESEGLLQGDILLKVRLHVSTVLSPLVPGSNYHFSALL